MGVTAENKAGFSWQKEEKKEPAKVGKAVQEILSKDQPVVEVGEVISEYADEYTEMVKKTIADNLHKYDETFYVVVLTKKEPWAVNVMRNWFIAKRYKPSARYIRNNHPNHMQTVYSFNPKDCELKLLWNLPTYQDAVVILKNWALYHSDLVKWIRDYESGKID